MTRVAVASVSQPAADAGARVADEGGNAVDAAVAAGLAATVTHPGMCSLGGAGYVTLWPASGDPATVDGGHEMPGRGLPPDRFGHGGVEVSLEYGGGVETVVGPGSVATPGLLAGLSLAAERWGHLPWRKLVEPAYELARDGFPFPAACHEFLAHAHGPIYSRDPRSRAALTDDEDRLLAAGETVRVEHLADTLRALADEGAGLFYRGELGRRIADHVQEGGGILTRRDLAAYRPVVRPPLEASLDGWTLATNPPPAVGGVTLAAMLALMDDAPRGDWTPEAVGHLVRVQAAVLTYRRRKLDVADDPDGEAGRLLRAAREGDPGALLRAAGATGAAAGGQSSRGDGSPADRPSGEGPRPGSASGATLHTSAVGSDGTACSVTLSDGYGSGIVPPGTGLWLNNCLGERELNRKGYHALEPGTRLPSNMAPTVARRDGAVLAIGSPGAGRIPTAVLQALLNHLRLGMPLQQAVEHPRLHAEPDEEGVAVTAEPGLPLEGLEGPAAGRADAGDGSPVVRVRRLDDLSMFFGGVEAAAWTLEGGFEVGADPRRAGGTAVGGE